MLIYAAMKNRANKLYDVIRASGVEASRIKISGEGVDKSYPTDMRAGLDLARRVSLHLE